MISPQAALRAVDVVLDRTVVAGYSRIGHVVRAATWSGARADPSPGALRGRTAVITGGSAGLGLAIAEGLAGLGAAVHLVVRDLVRGRRAVAGIRAAVPGAIVTAVRCDVADLDDVRRAVPALARLGPDLLVHNAGVMPPRRAQTAQGHETALATHVLGPHLLTAALLPTLRAAGDLQAEDSRVILVSSAGAYTARLDLTDPQSTRDPYNGAAAYARTKRMQVALAQEWGRRWTGTGVTAHAMHPGWVETPGLARSMPRFRTLLRPVLRTPAQGANTVVWLAAAPATVIGSGRFWHDRTARPAHYLPHTRETATERSALVELCGSLTGEPLTG